MRRELARRAQRARQQARDQADKAERRHQQHVEDQQAITAGEVDGVGEDGGGGRESKGGGGVEFVLSHFPDHPHFPAFKTAS